MGTTTFAFRQFTIKQDRCAMKVGTDGVLLGAWACLPAPLTALDIPAKEPLCSASDTGHPHVATSLLPAVSGLPQYSPTILDIGAGTGLISLMLAQRYPTAQIEAIEIDADAAEQCQGNFEASPWAARLCVHALSLRRFAGWAQPGAVGRPDVPPAGAQTPSGARRYDLIVSNPPFYDATLKPDSALRATARHRDALPVADIMNYARLHLSPAGTLALIYPVSYESALMEQYAVSGLHLQRVCDVVTRLGKSAARRMIQMGRLRAEQMDTMQLAIRDAQGAYTMAYRRLTAPFYLYLH